MRFRHVLTAGRQHQAAQNSRLAYGLSTGNQKCLQTRRRRRFAYCKQEGSLDEDWEFEGTVRDLLVGSSVANAHRPSVLVATEVVEHNLFQVALAVNGVHDSARRVSMRI